MAHNRIGNYIDIIRSNPHKTLFWVVLVTTAFILRSYNLKNQMFFGPEQGIDALVSYTMIHDGKMTLIGPKTDIAGLFHGPLFYYVSTFFYGLGGGNPVFVLNGFILLHILTIPFIFLLIKKLFNDRAAYIGAILFAFSYGSIVYSRWLSTHSLVFLLSVLFFLSYYYFFIKQKERFIVPLGVLYGFLSQAMFLNLLFFAGIICLGFVLFRPKIRNYLLFGYGLVVAFIFSIGHYIFFDLRHNWLITHSLVGLVKGERGFSVPFQSVVHGIINVYTTEFTSLFAFALPLLGILLLLVTLFILAANIKNKSVQLMICWVFLPGVLLLFFKHSPLSHFFVGTLIGMIVSVSYVLSRLNVIGTVVVCLIVIYNIVTWSVSLPVNRGMFFQSPQPHMAIQDQLELIDYVYSRTGQDDFSYEAYTVPYYMPQAWEYLFRWYGDKKYHKIPKNDMQKKYFAIYQTEGGEQLFLDAWLGTVKLQKQEKDNAGFGVLRAIYYETN